MRRSQLPKIVAAAMMAGLSIAPTPQTATVNTAARTVNTNTRGQRHEQPMPASNLSNLSAFNLRDMLDPVFGGSVRISPMWPHNRPQPGWRKVQSRARHAERMRRQRRNA